MFSVILTTLLIVATIEYPNKEMKLLFSFSFFICNNHLFLVKRSLFGCVVRTKNGGMEM